MAEFDENRYTDLLDHVARKAYADMTAESPLAQPWDDLDPMQKRGLKESLLPVVMAVDEYREAEAHKPKRDDDVAEWIKRERDVYWQDDNDDLNRDTSAGSALDALLDDYRLHADTGTPLSIDVSEMGTGAAE